MKKYLIITLILITSSVMIYLIKKEYNTSRTYNINHNNNTIIINYPSTNYLKLNNRIKKYLDKSINDFKNITLDTTKTTYYLIITYKEYQYQNLISYIFFYESYTGGAHPIHLIETFIYNKDTNSFITIESLSKNNKNILNILSNYTYKTLSNKKIFQIPTINNMLKEGTIPISNNYKNILFSNKGLIIYFERYQIAPYYYGDYNITIPYKLLNIKPSKL